MATPDPTSSDKAQVLVTDDSKVMRRAIQKILGDDADIIEAEDGEDGWKKIQQNPQIQVVITDIEMPVLDGYQLICRIRASEDTRIKKTPIITITGAEDEETKERAFACGATDFIVKPLDKLQLQARVQAHAKMDETARQLEETSTTLEEEATTDPLTGLASRRYFLQRGEQDVATAERQNADLSFMRFEIDNFKKLYQEYGDDVADQMLVFISKSLAVIARKGDTVARVGGADFAVIAPNTSKTEAAVLADRFRTTIANQPFNAGSGDVPLTVSIGVVTYGVDPAETLEELCDLAENRLRSAKAEGGNAVSASARNEAVAEEEVTISAPEDDVDDLELQLAEVIEQESLTLAAVKQAERTEQVAPSMPSGMPVELLNINQVLEMLADGKTKEINPYLLDLCLRVLPLLEHCDRSHRLDMSSNLDAIKEKLFSVK